MATRVRACLAHHALEGQLGAPAHVAFEKTGCPAKLVLLQGNGDVMQMLLSDLELVDIGEGRILIVPDIEPSELTLDDVCVLTLEDAEKFWEMVHRARTATHRDIWGDKLHSPWAPSTRVRPRTEDEWIRRGGCPRSQRCLAPKQRALRWSPRLDCDLAPEMVISLHSRDARAHEPPEACRRKSTRAVRLSRKSAQRLHWKSPPPLWRATSGRACAPPNWPNWCCCREMGT